MSATKTVAIPRPATTKSFSSFIVFSFLNISFCYAENPAQENTMIQNTPFSLILNNSTYWQSSQAFS